MIKTWIAIGSGVIFAVVAFYIGIKKESFFESTSEVEANESTFQESDDKFKILLESIN